VTATITMPLQLLKVLF